MNTTTYDELWNHPELVRRIDEGIERHRKTDVLLRVVDGRGRPVSGARVRVEQTGTPFLFGANIFMLGGYPDADGNARYERAFTGLFNSATVPFYWRGLELEPGRPRFEADSEPVPRRPPPDVVVEFCERHGLTMHGHTLVWDLAKWSVPDWLPDDPARSAPLWEARIRDIAQRYGDRISRWDVLNEVLAGGAMPRSRPMPPRYDRLAFTWAERWLPAGAFFQINEVTGAWHGDGRRRYLELIRQLRSEGARVDGVGLQFHVFTDDEFRSVLAGDRYRPLDLLASLDEFAALDLPVHVSEITLPSLDNDRAGQLLQAQAARNFYRLWFSHPAVNAITWWNVPDGGAAEGEGQIASGLLTRDIEPKPGYDVLHDLIHREWRTRFEGATGPDGTLAFRGFHGDYSVAADTGVGEIRTTLRVDSSGAVEHLIAAECVEGAI